MYNNFNSGLIYLIAPAVYRRSEKLAKFWRLGFLNREWLMISDDDTNIRSIGMGILNCRGQAYSIYERPN